MSKKQKGDVIWFSNKRKKPVAYSTIADSDAIGIINQPHKTANDLMSVLKSGQYLVSEDMIRVVQSFIDSGFGEDILNTRII